MASVEDCERALATLAQRLADKNADSGSDLDRNLTCTIRDLDVVFAGRLHGGRLEDIKQADDADPQGREAVRDAQVKLAMSSDDLLALVDGTLNLASAWASGRVKVSAGVRDMMRLRSIF